MPTPGLAIGPSNHAGQAHAWARAVRRYLPAEAWSFTTEPLRGPHAFRFATDRSITGISDRCPVLRRLRSRHLFRHTSHIALDGFRTYYRAFQRGHFAGDARWLAERWEVALIAHGTDTRSPERHMDRLRWSYFRDGSDEWRAALSASAAENRAIAKSLGLPLFYATPDLALDLPAGTWLPVCVDVDAWACDTPVLERRVPRVVHIPSHSRVKGTRYIAAVLSELATRGVVEYVSPGQVPHRQMRALIQSADIVIDQILTGSYGVAAVEAMAAGRVLIGSLASDVAALMPQAPGLLNADPDTLEEVVLFVLDSRDEQRQVAAANVAFARRWHDGRESARRLAGFLGVEAQHA